MAELSLYREIILSVNFDSYFKRSLASNYRPISLTCILCKILESLVRKAIIIHLTDNNLFSNKQFGFMNGRSTTLQLMHYLDKCVESVAQGRVVDVIYFDFQKAFDMVPHKKLLSKINSFGIRGKLLRWIENFIVGRKQCVPSSEWRKIKLW